MPKTASKRAQARKMARVTRAHVEAPKAPVARRPSAVARRRKPRGLAGFVQRYPWATTFFVIVVLGLVVAFVHAERVWPFAPVAAKPKATVSATTAQTTGCDLKTHHCAAPTMTIDASKTYTATITTAKGNIVIALDAKNAPIAANDFVYLADQHYYDGTYFWRVEAPGLTSPLGGPSTLQLIQGGSVASNGQDAADIPGFTINDETVVGNYTAGTVAMAKTSQPNSGSSQFFIDTGDNSSQLSKSYTIFGQVTSGLDIAKKIAPADKIESVTIAVK